MQINVDTVEFLNVPPNSVLIFKVPNHIAPEELIHLRKVLLERHLPNIVDVLVVSGACELSVIGQDRLSNCATSR